MSLKDRYCIGGCSLIDSGLAVDSRSIAIIGRMLMYWSTCRSRHPIRYMIWVDSSIMSGIYMALFVQREPFTIQLN